MKYVLGVSFNYQVAQSPFVYVRLNGKALRYHIYDIIANVCAICVSTKSIDEYELHESRVQCNFAIYL